jgi:hypothetical protein
MTSVETPFPYHEVMIVFITLCVVSCFFSLALSAMCSVLVPETIDYPLWLDSSSVKRILKPNPWDLMLTIIGIILIVSGYGTLAAWGE